MSRDYDANAAPHAFRTAWAASPDGSYVLVLENEDGKPIAYAGYGFASWMAVFESLKAIEEAKDERAAVDRTN